MPNIDDFKSNKKAAKEGGAPSAKRQEESEILKKAAKKRRLRDEMASHENEGDQVVSLEGHENFQAESVSPGNEKSGSSSKNEPDMNHKEEPFNEPQFSNNEEKIRIQFDGSEILRHKFPRTFDLAEAVLNEWVNDGDFSSVPLENPFAKEYFKRSLMMAKQVEKAVVSSPYFEKVAMQGLETALKVQATFSKFFKK